MDNYMAFCMGMASSTSTCEDAFKLVGSVKSLASRGIEEYLTMVKADEQGSFYLGQLAPEVEHRGPVLRSEAADLLVQRGLDDEDALASAEVLGY